MEVTRTASDASALLPYTGWDTAPAAPVRGADAVPLYWYWIGHGHTATIRAGSEDEARAAILARHPHAHGQRLTITAWED